MKVKLKTSYYWIIKHKETNYPLFDGISKRKEDLKARLDEFSNKEEYEIIRVKVEQMR